MTGARKDIADQFYALSVMLRDLDRGIVHPMLLAKKPRGRLDDRSDVWAVRVIAACGVECLIRSGLSRREAGRRAAKEFPAVCTENSDSHVLVMQSAEERMRPNATDPVNGARQWCIFVQRAVRSQIVVIPGIGLQNPA